MSYNSSFLGAGLILVGGICLAGVVATGWASQDTIPVIDAHPSVDVELLAPSGATLEFFKMSTRAAPSEYDKPKCGMYSYNTPEGYSFTANEKFLFSAAARVAAEVQAITNRSCNCPYDRNMPVEPVLAVIAIAGTPEETKNGGERHRLNRVAEELQEKRLARCAG